MISPVQTQVSSTPQPSQTQRITQTPAVKLQTAPVQSVPSSATSANSLSITPSGISVQATNVINNGRNQTNSNTVHTLSPTIILRNPSSSFPPPVHTAPSQTPQPQVIQGTSIQIIEKANNAKLNQPVQQKNSGQSQKTSSQPTQFPPRDNTNNNNKTPSQPKQKENEDKKNSRN